MRAPTLYVCRCTCGCGQETEVPIPMGDLIRPSGASQTLYVCPNCVLHVTPKPHTDELMVRQRRF